ncbi:carboxymuconolactone decarboxylase family protein [Microbacterium paludicola]|jgi:AhpD family alkylhydroperoxidase|uniref:Carboxymuconolactone decarboxylase family protein n=1 Tax=Microbacterium paludicola TaxID=300019 RepID=A0A4Y9FVT5_9MICO|nr:carboxymuconolactone decarboxylase family protein [Microbacterium paludicola]MBF0816308.1 carboxymuconolactone decarboxylase family protein [Microbacterium paludicola]TFU32974.1 carboxymuconolactone decarboxylase family protein [Microbacterium paludicola]
MAQPRVHLSKSEPTAYKALDAFSREVGRIAKENGVDDRLKELVLLHCSQLNSCAYCTRIHSDRGLAAGIGYDDLAQLPVWRESGVFTERERAALELAEAYTFIHRGGIPDDVYDRVGAVLSEKEYLGVSWLAISINAFNRVVIAGRYPVPPREGGAAAPATQA